MTANGSAEPYPIPALDKNGSHNQFVRTVADDKLSVGQRYLLCKADTTQLYRRRLWSKLGLRPRPVWVFQIPTTRAL